ncbi:MAG: NAD(+) synthase [Lachnospiraceae bacterium]|nr:NAD(+) synthase [Lachnospiraceae bacterium]MDD3660730.1 NAD(+) synthase [Lachnospiraceae bacterium]
MKHGFIKTAAVSPVIKVADTEYNADRIIESVADAHKNGAKIIVLPELCLTGYTCHDLFLQDTLLQGAISGLIKILRETADIDALIFVGLPLEKDQKLYNVAAVLNKGQILAFIPKQNLPNYAEFYEHRHFAAGNQKAETVLFQNKEIPFGTDILFNSDAILGLCVACEVCEDLWAPDPPNTRHALAGASIIVNLSASNETVGKEDYRRLLLKATSGRLLAGYIYASAGEGESTQDIVFGSHNMIAENGSLLAEAERFTGETIYADLDIKRIRGERRRNTTFQTKGKESYLVIPFTIMNEETALKREFDRTPFVPADLYKKEQRCEDILKIQAFGLKKRLDHTQSKTAIIGLSGGLDSTLALLVTVRAFELSSMPKEQIIAVTMPCFGTTDRTYQNACRLAGILGTTLMEIDLKRSVLQHFKDIGHDENIHDVTYENGQARERTQVLMDLANKTGGMVIGTGDMSELALGWATYNGDHMSMYGVNCGVPKTLVRHLVRHFADTYGNKELTEILADVLDTPVSPELLPPSDGTISQITEDLVGPYELHDFFLYYMLRFGYEPDKIYRIAVQTFSGIYDQAELLKWLKVFYRRFFTQQFKRSCLPDGPKVGSVAVSPRGDLRMPSDACMTLWMEKLEEL